MDTVVPGKVKSLEPWPVDPPSIAAPRAAPKVYAAIAAVMRGVGAEGVSKARKNDQQGYMFRGIDDVYNALSGVLSAAGLCILPRVKSRTVTERATQKGGVLFYVVLDMDFDIVCAEDASVHTVSVVGEAMDSGDKATNKAMSAAFKYACMQVFCIPTEGNPDADQTTHDVAPQPIPEDCWTALNDAAALGERELRRVWKEEISEPTRLLIVQQHAERWDSIKLKAVKGPQTPIKGEKPSP